jgi:hypothetical protein
MRLSRRTYAGIVPGAFILPENGLHVSDVHARLNSGVALPVDSVAWHKEPPGNHNGEERRANAKPVGRATTLHIHRWQRGPDYITVAFRNNAAYHKELYLADTREMLEWYAKKAAEKIGVKWR